MTGGYAGTSRETGVPLPPKDRRRVVGEAERWVTSPYTEAAPSAAVTAPGA